MFLIFKNCMILALKFLINLSIFDFFSLLSNLLSYYIEDKILMIFRKIFSYKMPKKKSLKLNKFKQKKKCLKVC